MKKIITFTLALMMVFALAACGDTGKTPSGSTGNTQTDPPSSQGGNTETPGGSDKADITTVAGWLTNWGLTENDLKCAHFTRLDKTSYNSETLEIKSVGAYCDTKLTEEEVRAWLGQLLAKLNSMSAEGKLVDNLHDNAELTVDYIIEKGETYLYTAIGNFTYNGKDTTAIITVTPNQLDDADPDEAMAACMIELYH